ncbi:polyprenyl synthetase family protein [Legionella spiritensis]|uniref:polyprenyl synthetase family protein n=1 Tax=Legionella spiritensis TaxID=452 RepID=UPI000F6F42A3|nr:polyprenyl synthetase family protein [Legionella spiritensis]VEG92270.1 geranyltranstransferase [Legionella spiritensis]
MINNRFTAFVNRHEDVLHQLLASSEIAAPRLKEAISYALFPGGKRLRPLLIYLFGELLSVELACLDIIAAAMEFTHCYSLVHDDLPAMDDDDLRRGKPSCHRAFDEATAILVGDGLQMLAIDILLDKLAGDLPASKIVAITKTLSRASGVAGMVSGQSLDLTDLAQPSVHESQLRRIHTLKTGRLILACADMTIAAADQPDPEAMTALRDYAAHLGLVFQMQDDYLDQYAGGTHGKGRLSDEMNDKVTYATLYSRNDLQNLVHDHYRKARQALACFGDRAADLLTLTETLQYR